MEIYFAVAPKFYIYTLKKDCKNKTKRLSEFISNKYLEQAIFAVVIQDEVYYLYLLDIPIYATLDRAKEFCDDSKQVICPCTIAAKKSGYVLGLL